jgi:hypothetical protein
LNSRRECSASFEDTFRVAESSCARAPDQPEAATAATTTATCKLREKIADIRISDLIDFTIVILTPEIRSYRESNIFALTCCASRGGIQCPAMP